MDGKLDAHDAAGAASSAPAATRSLAEVVLDAVPFYVMLVDAEHRVLYANRATSDALGASPRELVGRYCPKQVHGRDDPYPGCPLEEAGGRPIAVEREFYEAGAQMWVRSAVYPTGLGGNGAPAVYAHVIASIDERKRAEQALEERVAVETLVSAIARGLLGAPSDEIEGEVGRALCAVAEFVGAARASVYLLDEQGEQLRLARQWQLAGAELAPLARELEPSMLGALRTMRGPGSVLHGTRDAGAASERERGNREPSAEIPIVLGGSVRGLLRIDAVDGAASPRLHDGHLHERLQSTVSAAFERSRAARELSSYAAELRRMALEASAAEQRERRQLASDLHDGIGQILALSMLKLSKLEASCESAALAAALEEIRGHIDHALGQAKTMMFDLSPPVLHQFGLGAALEWLLEQHGAQGGLRCQLGRDGVELALEDDQRMFLFRAVQELLANVRRHAQATEVRVALTRTAEGIEIEVDDDGVGIASEAMRRGAPGAPRGFGLFSIAERLRHLGGTLDARRRPGGGTRVWLRLPLATAADEGAAP